MNSIEVRLTNKTKRDLEKMLADSKKRGNLREVNRCKAVLSVLAGCDSETVSRILRVCRESIRIWLNKFILKGVEGLKSVKPPGRPSKLTKKEKTELKRLISRRAEIRRVSRSVLAKPDGAGNDLAKIRSSVFGRIHCAASEKHGLLLPESRICRRRQGCRGQKKVARGDLAGNREACKKKSRKSCSATKPPFLNGVR